MWCNAFGIENECDIVLKALLIYITHYCHSSSALNSCFLFSFPFSLFHSLSFSVWCCTKFLSAFIVDCVIVVGFFFLSSEALVRKFSDRSMAIGFQIKCVAIDCQQIDNERQEGQQKRAKKTILQ